MPASLFFVRAQAQNHANNARKTFQARNPPGNSITIPWLSAVCELRARQTAKWGIVGERKDWLAKPVQGIHKECENGAIVIRRDFGDPSP